MQESKISEYFDDVAQSLMSNYKRLELLLPNTSLKKNSDELKGGSDHYGEEGRFLENVIRSFLNKHLPKNLRALSGFILRPAAAVAENDTRRLRDQKIDLHSPQLDIIVYDAANYPVFEQYEDFAIVPPEGVYAIISVKKRLYKKDIEKELKALSYSASLCSHYNKNKAEKIKGYPPNQRVAGPITALIGFKTNFELDDENSKMIFDKIKNVQGEYPVDGIVKMISSIEDFTFLRGDHRYEKSKNAFRVPFIWIKHKTDVETEPKMNLSIQYLLHFILRLYYNSTRQALLIKPGFNQFDENERKNKKFGNKLYIKQEHFLKELEFKD